jgi:hypothetical protein
MDEKLSEAKKRLIKEKNDLLKILSIPEGRRFLWKLLDQSGVFRTVFNTDTHAMAFNEGWRSMGLSILNDITSAKAEAFDQMRRENVKKED